MTYNVFGGTLNPTLSWYLMGMSCRATDLLQAHILLLYRLGLGLVLVVLVSALNELRVSSVVH